MSQKVNDSFIVNAGGSWVYLAYITGADGDPIIKADLSTISRRIYNTVTKVETVDSITVATVIDDTPFTDSMWSETRNMTDVVQATKVNTRVTHTLQYTFTPNSGEVFKSREVNIEGD